MKKITLFVISVHLFLISALLFSPPKKADRKAKHITVHTLRSSPQPRAATALVAALPQQRPTKKTAPAPSKTKKESPAAKTAPSKPAPATSKPIQQKKPAVVEKGKPAKPAKIWKEIDEALAKIDDTKYSKPRSKLDVPQVKGSPAVQIPFPDFDEAESHEETLISFLHASLNLPEFGEVKIQLTIKKDGSVVRLVVLESESLKNKAYLQQHLPLLKFPLIFDNDKTITLTFCNEI